MPKNFSAAKIYVNIMASWSKIASCNTASKLLNEGKISIIIIFHFVFCFLHQRLYGGEGANVRGEGEMPRNYSPLNSVRMGQISDFS